MSRYSTKRRTLTRHKISDVNDVIILSNGFFQKALCKRSLFATAKPGHPTRPLFSTASARHETNRILEMLTKME